MTNVILCSVLFFALASVEVLSANVKDAEIILDSKSYGASSLSAAESASETVTVTYTLDGDVEPHQNFLRLTHVESGLNSYYVFSSTESKYTVALKLSEESQTLMFNSGEYKATLLIGDLKLEKSIEHKLGTFSLALPAAPPAAELPLYRRPLLHESDTTLKALPEIHHVFRDPVQPPAAILPYFFAGCSVTALVGLLVALPSAGANLTGVSGSGMGFVACMGAMLALFGVYWLQLTMSYTLKILVPLTLVTALVGHRALSQLAERRLQAENKKPKAD